MSSVLLLLLSLHVSVVVNVVVINVVVVVDVVVVVTVAAVIIVNIVVVIAVGIVVAVFMSSRRFIFFNVFSSQPLLCRRLSGIPNFSLAAWTDLT